MTEAEQKKILRAQIRARMTEFPEAYLEESDREIEKQVLRLPEWNRAERLFVYCSVGREVQTMGLIRAALAAGKTVALPKCEGKGRMTAYCIKDLKDLVPGVFGIPEPAAGESLEAEAADTAIVPALAFDRRGFRLGQGGGYYDRWLAKFSGVSIGLCREALLQDSVPAEGHDLAAAIVVTERQILRP